MRHFGVIFTLLPFSKKNDDFHPLKRITVEACDLLTSAHELQTQFHPLLEKFY